MERVGSYPTLAQICTRVGEALKRTRLMKRLLTLCGVLTLMAILALQGTAYACPA